MMSGYCKLEEMDPITCQNHVEVLYNVFYGMLLSFFATAERHTH